MQIWKRWRKIIIIALAVGLAYTGYALWAHAGSDYITVSELKSQASSLAGRQVRVGGKIAAGSIDWDNSNRTMIFALTDDQETLNITYQGTVPDNFKPGADLVVAGRYQADNILEASGFGTPRSLCNICH